MPKPYKIIFTNWILILHFGLCPIAWGWDIEQVIYIIGFGFCAIGFTRFEDYPTFKKEWDKLYGEDEKD